MMRRLAYKPAPVRSHHREMACPCSYRIPDRGQPSPMLCIECGKMTMERVG